MSRNFELLQQIGNDDDLFQTEVQSKEPSVAVEFEPGSALDKETFEKLMEKASLSGLFQTSNELSQQIPIEPAGSNPDADAKSASRRVPRDAAAGAFRTSRNPTSPIGDLGMTAENRLRQSAAKTASLPNAFRSNVKRGALRRTLGEELPLPEAKRKVQQKNYQKHSFSLLDSIKSAAKGWEWRKRLDCNHGGADLEAITREEEIKLVQRVFHGTGPDSPRVALFAGLENEAQCASTCARVAELLAARAEGPVCIVDANFLKPTLHEYFGVDNLKGLAEATVESGPVQNFAQQIPEPDLWLISSGKAAAEMRFPAMADGLRVRIEELRDTFRYVVIHSASLRVETNAMLLSRWTDGVVLVLEAHATRRDAARRVKGMLDAADISLLGVVLNNRRFPIPESIYSRL